MSQVVAYEIKVGAGMGCDDLHSRRQMKERLGGRLQEAIVLVHRRAVLNAHDGWVTVRPLDRPWR